MDHLSEDEKVCEIVEVDSLPEEDKPSLNPKITFWWVFTRSRPPFSVAEEVFLPNEDIAETMRNEDLHPTCDFYTCLYEDLDTLQKRAVLAKMSATQGWEEIEKQLRERLDENGSSV